MKLESKTVVECVETLFREAFAARCTRRKTFPWLTHQGKPIVVTAYFGPPLHCLFEFDPVKRFNQDRLRTLRSLPSDAPLGFDFAWYVKRCEASRAKASARTRRQAAMDACVDLMPTWHGLNPTLRLSESELRANIEGRLTEARLRAAVETLLKTRFSLHAGTAFLQSIEHPSGKPFVPVARIESRD